MNVISFSLFNDCHPDDLKHYVDGVGYNVRMARLLFPDWSINLEGDFAAINHLTAEEYDKFFSLLNDNGVQYDFGVFKPVVPRCTAMLWRLFPIYNIEGVDRVICRDLDGLLTYRDMMSVQRWIESGKSAHGMNDNPAHGGMKLMGGMCGFKADKFKEKFPSWDKLIEGYDLSQHGSDQLLLQQRVLPAFENDLYFDREPLHYPFSGLAESDLCVRHIGSAGINELETKRFLRKYEK